jgi:hypothetical protein
VCVCSLSYPACHAHAPYYVVICGLPDCTICFHIISYTARFSGGKKLLNINCVSWFSIKCLSEIFLIVRRIARDIIINVRRSTRKVPAILVRCNQIWIFSTYFWKILKHETSRKSVNCEPSCSIQTERRTDRHGKANSRFSQLCDRASNILLMLFHIFILCWNKDNK